MKTIQLITDGASDIAKNECEKLDIINIPFYVMKKDEEESKEYENDELYTEMINNKKQIYKTACPSPQIYYEVFLIQIENDKDIICICISSQLSGSYYIKICYAILLYNN